MHRHVGVGGGDFGVGGGTFVIEVIEPRVAGPSTVLLTVLSGIQSAAALEIALETALSGIRVATVSSLSGVRSVTASVAVLTEIRSATALVSR